MKRSSLKRKTPLRAKKPMERKPKPDLKELLESGKVKRASSLPKKINARTEAMEYADAMFSKWTRLKAADENGYLHCFICGDRVHWKEAVLMHCEGRGAWSVRYSEINGQAGDSACNGKDLGDRDNFRAKLDVVFGPGTWEGNYRKSKEMMKHSNSDLRFIGDTYAERIEWIRKHEPSKFDEQ